MSPNEKCAAGSQLRRRVGNRVGRTVVIVLAFSIPVAASAWFLYETRLLLNPPTDLEEHRVDSDRWDGPTKIAIIRLEGTIISGEGHLKRQIERVAADPDVKAIVLRINSPGGTVTGSDYMLHHLKELKASRGADKIPLVVSMGSLAASGGYYVAMSVEDTPMAIFAEPTTWTGSIGVIIPHYNVADLLAEHGIESDSIKSHPLKGIGSVTRKMTTEERAILQALVDESYTEFKNIVASGRPQMTAEQIEDISTGQVFTARQALQNGLVDKIGFLEDAVARAAELAGTTAEDVHVVEYRQPNSMFQFSLLGKSAHTPSWQDLMTNATTPQAYYLWTFLPGVLDDPAE
ncbi:MAG: signal peptide peptidase SppA [Pirellulales bacterium]|nr:signal peptide peptidase SppA [Pirellulales bacterium]